MAILSGSISKEFEIWKDIVGYEGLYQISNLGRVKKFEKICATLQRRIKSCT